ncbi:MAG: PQQ-binding-like beta-propeller repeat protein [Opitutales bacterium]
MTSWLSPWRRARALAWIGYLGLALPVAASVSTPEAWPMHRGGPDMLGRVAGNVMANPELAWETEVGAGIAGGPAVAADAVFIGSIDGQLTALNLDDGTVRWQKRLPADIEATPCVANGLVFIGCADGTFFAFDATDGSERWRFKTEDKVLGGAVFVAGTGAAPARVVFGSYDSYLYCLNAADGSLLWRFGTDNYIHGSPTILTDGQEQTVVFGGCDGFVYRLRLADGELLAAIDSGAYIPSSVPVYSGFGYLGNYDDVVMAVNLADESIAWRYQDRDFPFFSSPAVTEDTLFIGSRDKRLHAIDRQTGQRRWVFTTRGRVDASPLVYDDAVVAGSSDGRLYALQRSSGQVRWQMDLGAPLTGSPAAVAGWILIGAEDGYLYALRSAEKG